MEQVGSTLGEVAMKVVHCTSSRRPPHHRPSTMVNWELPIRDSWVLHSEDFILRNCFQKCSGSLITYGRKAKMGKNLNETCNKNDKRKYFHCCGKTLKI